MSSSGEGSPRQLYKRRRRYENRLQSAVNDQRNDQRRQRRRMSARSNERNDQRNYQQRQRRRIARGHDAQGRIQYLNIGGKTDIDTLQAADLPSVYKLSEDYTADKVCGHCGAMGYHSELVSTGRRGSQPNFGKLCCHGGKVNLILFPQPPDSLKNLIDGTDDDSSFFLKNIRKFNSGMAMASFQFTDTTVGGNKSMIRIQGQVYHCVGPMRNAAVNSTNFIQTYFLDPEQQAMVRG